MPRTPRTSKKGSSSSTRPAWPDRFLVELAARGTVLAAAKAIGIGRTTVYDELKRNSEFAADVRAVQEQCVHEAESTLYQRAIAGDNTCLIFYLKGRNAEVFGDGLRAQQIEQIRAAALREVQAQLEEDIAQLPKAAREIVIAAMRKRKELTP